MDFFFCVCGSDYNFDYDVGVIICCIFWFQKNLYCVQDFCYNFFGDEFYGNVIGVEMVDMMFRFKVGRVGFFVCGGVVFCFRCYFFVF